MPLPKRRYSKRGERSYHVDHPLYLTWHGMMRRCYCDCDISYSNYGARGISVCDDWHYFKNFLRDMGEKPTQHHSLDRVDNNLGYSKYNCRWATRSEQCDNRRLFKNNTSGHRGITKSPYSFIAKYDYENKRYEIGRFINFDDAVAARESFVKMFHLDRARAIASISGETVWNNSTTKCRGIRKNEHGSYVARATVSGVRHYIGSFKTIEEAESARLKFITSRT